MINFDDARDKYLLSGKGKIRLSDKIGSLISHKRYRYAARLRIAKHAHISIMMRKNWKLFKGDIGQVWTFSVSKKAYWIYFNNEDLDGYFYVAEFEKSWEVSQEINSFKKSKKVQLKGRLYDDIETITHQQSEVIYRILSIHGLLKNYPFILALLNFSQNPCIVRDTILDLQCWAGDHGIVVAV